MIPILFKLGPITVYSYGLMMALGFLAADLVIASECRWRGFNPDYASSIVVWGAIGGIAGARLYDVFDELPMYLSHPSSIIFSGSGFVWFGGLIGGLIACMLVSRHYKVNLGVTADMAAPALLLGHALGRIGCLVSGDGDWGIPTKLPWGMSFPHAIVGWNANTVLTVDHGQLVSAFYPGVRVHPTPIYEAVLYVAIFCFLWSIRKTNRVNGRLFYLYLILAGAARFAVEFLRINPRVLFGLSEAQVISVVMMVVGTAAYLYTSRSPSTALETVPAGASPAPAKAHEKAARA